MAIDSPVVAGPRMHEAPLSATVRAADSAACGSPCGSAVAIFTAMPSPAACAALLATLAPSLVALSNAGPVSESAPVSSGRVPMVR